LVKSCNKDSQDIEHYTCVKNAEGHKLIQHEDVQKRWQQHFTDIGNVEFPHPPIITGPISQITETEVGRTIKNGKSQDPMISQLSSGK